jgi:PD-(D/E)XK endonuclease
VKNTCKIGNLTVAKLLVALAEKGKIVLTPFGEGGRYDLLIDEDGKFTRTQCKTGKLKSGAIVFRNYSQTGAGTKAYGKSVDAYGVYCPQNGKCYLVPAKVCAGFITTLRVEEAKNNRRKKIRLAAKYEI